ncbi:MAG: radical SAM protein [Parvibaculaceae bacterium]
MPRSIYIINPQEAAPYFFSSEVLTATHIGRFPIVADLATPTVAALVPEDWTIEICDERRDAVDLDTRAEVVAITAKVSQRGRMKVLAREFRRRGKLVIVGGPHVSLWPDDLRGLADVLVIGEIEDIAHEVFADIAAGRPKPEYRGGKPDLSLSPKPRWDLYRFRHSMAGQVQTSRGCPFECDFCDVIQYLGRKQRWKEPDQVLGELDALYRLGCRDVLLADDNFTVMRKRARTLLAAIEAWNDRQTAGRMRFATQLSIDAARDRDLLDLAVRAGLDRCFIGIETPNEDALKEALKRQNLRVDLAEEVGKIVGAGLLPLCGMIVGFDHDGPDIFERQARFIASLPAPVIQMGLLVAPHGTPLWARIKAEGRLDEDFHGEDNLLGTNIQPRLMSAAELKSGWRRLLNDIYDPWNWLARVEHFAEVSPANVNRRGLNVFSLIEARLAAALAKRGETETALVARLETLVRQRPDLLSQIGYSLIVYCQTRHMLDHFGLWDESLHARRPTAMSHAYV